MRPAAAASGAFKLQVSELMRWSGADTAAYEGEDLVWNFTLSGASVLPTATKIEIVSGTATAGSDAQNFLGDNSLVSFDGGSTWGQPVYNGNMVAVPRAPRAWRSASAPAPTV